jgi:DNA invertase Pin-like site-specific DNA recombinase
VTTWKERHDEAVRKQEAAQLAYQQASEDRARALLDGEAELGSQAAVARELGVGRSIVNRAIKALEKKQQPK